MQQQWKGLFKRQSGGYRGMSELFEALAVIGDPETEEDWIVHLLDSMPDYVGNCSGCELSGCAKDENCNGEIIAQGKKKMEPDVID